MLLGQDWLTKPLDQLMPGAYELAAFSGVVLTHPTPTSDEIQRLYKLWGPEREFEKNMPVMAAALRMGVNNVPDQNVLQLLKMDGTLDGFELRGLRGPVSAEAVGPVIALVCGATIRQMKQRVAELQWQITIGLKVAKIFACADVDRICNLDSELLDEDVRSCVAPHAPPYESNMLGMLLRRAGLEFEPISGGRKFSDHVTLFAKQNPWAAAANIYTPTNGNASHIPLGIYVYLRKLWPWFDLTRTQLVFSQHGVVLAENVEQANDLLNYQKAMTVPAGLVRLMMRIESIQRMMAASN